MPKKAKVAADYILPLYMNGLSGRMMRLPGPKAKKREILFVYGHHSSLERWFGVAELLSRYGNVTVPDLPGFGGMQPFYKIGEKATLDNMADYLAAFIKLRYRSKTITVSGLSLGFVIVTRMLQKYPELTNKVNLLVSFAGFVHRDDFIFKKPTFYIFRHVSSIFSRKLPAAFIQHFIFRRFIIKNTYRFVEKHLVKDAHSKMHGASEEERQRRVDFEVKLWQSNEARTYMAMANIMFKLDLTKQHVDLEVYHIAVDTDRYFDNLLVEQHMRLIFKDFYQLKSASKYHAPSVISNAKEASPFLPLALRRILNKDPK